MVPRVHCTVSRKGPTLSRAQADLEFGSRTLTGISIFCLANRKSAWFTRIFGGAAGNEGLGMFALCLDWNYVGSGGGSMGALFTPISTQLSLYVGVLICM